MSDQQTSKVSVCLASYNGEKFIREQILSILAQLSEEDELIVSDDGSTDHTLEILESIPDNRICIYHNAMNKGVIGNFENALNKATGDCIFLSDQDDLWLPDKKQKMQQLLASYDLVVSDCKIVDGDNKILVESFFQQFGSGPGFRKNFIKNTYLGCCMAFRKELLKYVLPFPADIAMHDIWIGLNAEIRGSTYFTESPLLLYRRHGANASCAAEKSPNSVTYKIKYRAIMLYRLLQRALEQK